MIMSQLIMVIAVKIMERDPDAVVMARGLNDVTLVMAAKWTATSYLLGPLWAPLPPANHK
jgi:hypothetical protein